ncbi:MAG: FAD-dependent oxidoreductase [Lysobacter sp.]|nr:FAD-dependent oxidoreductase [Lysobacter sp.]
MKIAVIGSGIAGLGSAWLLSRKHDVTLFEANDYLGGHTHTHDIELQGRHYAVDTGFIVFNGAHYPLLTRLFAELGVETQPTTMSFSVQNQASGMEYNAGTVDGLFCQRKNLLNPRFLRMAADIVRFYRNAPALLRRQGAGPTLGEFLTEKNYSAAFRDEHIVPMAAALWSMSASQVLQFPLLHLLRFMDNHHMLQVNGRPEWRVVTGGSQRYIDAMRARWTVQERIGCPVRGIAGIGGRVQIDSAAGQETFDHVVLACHADQALAMLRDATPTERRILEAMPFQDNEVVLHTDARLLPKHRKAWAAWNAYVPAPGHAASEQAHCTVSYCMNLLQSLDAPEPIVVTLNRSAEIDPGRILRRLRYQHPLQTLASVAAQARKVEIQGQRNLWFAGAYWGYGFHEDGLRSAVEVAQGLGVAWP